jgi:peptidoglycan/LPS O-acetylase OafA/YrhL
LTEEGDAVLVAARSEPVATDGVVESAAPVAVEVPAAERTRHPRPSEQAERAEAERAETDAAVTEPSRFRLGNRPPLTGIRALVIGSILVYHSNLANPHSDFTALPGAWAAISVFFVLSGFLITSMLMAERERKGRISLGNFYTRRALRLLPPLGITIGLLAIYAALVYVPFARQRIWDDMSAATFYYADFRSASGHEFFLGYLGQAWSLSIEEQFYVIWSVLLLGATLFHRRTAAYVLALGGIGLSAAYGFWLLVHARHFSGAVANQVYYGFAPRADALFVGCLLGLLATGGHFDRVKRWGRWALAVAALAAASLLGWIVVEVTFGTRSSLLLWLPVSVLLSAVLIVYFVICPSGVGSRLVGIAPLVLVGNLAYTLYLVHWPVYMALSPLTTHMSFWPLEAIRLAVVFGIALASWYLVERPLMNWRRRRLA